MLHPLCERASCLAVTGLHWSLPTPHDSPMNPDACGAFVLSHDPLSLPFSRHPTRSQMKRIVVLAFIQYVVHVDGATIHVDGPDERQVEFGDGTTSFATLSGGEGFINSTVTVNAPNFVTMAGSSVSEMVSLIRENQATIVSQQAEIEALKQFVGMMPSPPKSPPPPPSPPPFQLPSPGAPPLQPLPCDARCETNPGELADMCKLRLCTGCAGCV